MSDNTITLSGNLTRDPELRYTDSGRPVSTAAVAVNHRYQTGGDWQERVSYFDVVAWGGLGEHIAKSLHKGDAIVVTGRMEQRSWETDTGDTRTKVELVATDVGASLRWASAELTRAARTSDTPHHDHADRNAEPEPTT